MLLFYRRKLKEERERENSVVVYLAGDVTLPDDHVAQLFIQLPPSPTFMTLGTLSNAKKSAIYKLSSLKEALTQPFSTGQATPSAGAIMYLLYIEQFARSL